MRMPRSCSLRSVTAPTPHSRPTGSGCRNASSSSGSTSSRPSGFATPLATFARSFVVAMPTVSGSPTCSRTAVRSRVAISKRRAGDRLQAADVEERLVDRDALDGRGGLLEDRLHRLARLDVGRESRRHDDRLRAQPPRLRAAHRRPHAERARLVARREHDAPADDHRPRAQRRVVALLDGGEERVEVRVEDRRLARHEHMFARISEERHASIASRRSRQRRSGMIVRPPSRSGALISGRGIRAPSSRSSSVSSSRLAVGAGPSVTTARSGPAP